MKNENLINDQNDIEKNSSESADNALKELGVVNILTVGRPGVGKSTLINAVFRGELAKTGQGKPVTKHIQEIKKEGIPVELIDTVGLEIKNYKKILKQLENYIKKRNQLTDPTKHIHIAWFCIPEALERTEDVEIKDLFNLLNKFVPVIVVITKSIQDNFKESVKKNIPDAKYVIPIIAKDIPVRNRKPIESYGLDALIDKTMKLVPKAQINAFIAAQKINIDLKIKSAREIVLYHSSATALAAVLNPIPGTDAFYIVPIQINMMAKISVIFGISTDKKFLGTLIAGALVSVAAPEAGRTIYYSITKALPILNISAQILQGSTAALVTAIFGEAYIKTLAVVLNKGLEKSEFTKEVAKIFKQELKKIDKEKKKEIANEFRKRINVVFKEKKKELGDRITRILKYINFISKKKRSEEEVNKKFEEVKDQINEDLKNI